MHLLSLWHFQANDTNHLWPTFGSPLLLFPVPQQWAFQTSPGLKHGVDPVPLPPGGVLRPQRRLLPAPPPSPSPQLQRARNAALAALPRSSSAARAAPGRGALRDKAGRFLRVGKASGEAEPWPHTALWATRLPKGLAPQLGTCLTQWDGAQLHWAREVFERKAKLRVNSDLLFKPVRGTNALL